MSLSSFLAVSAGSCGVAMAVSPLLQIRTMVRRRSSADVSLGYLSVLVVGFTMWLAYGVTIANAALIVTNVTSLTVGITTIAVARHYRGREDLRVPDAEDEKDEGVGPVRATSALHEPSS